jgi:peptidoglycan/LPS O-acetylase OafA/YrhL
MGKRWFNNIEGGRGYMSLWVYVTHVVTFAALPIEKGVGLGNILANGNHAVIVFILMSGFVIERLLRKDEPYLNYIFRRAFRLFPCYLVALFISILMLDFSKEVLTNIPWDNIKNVSRINTIDVVNKHYWVHIISHVFLLHGLIPNTIIPATYSIMGQSWSLTLEWQFYLAAPFLIGLVKDTFSKQKSFIIILLLLLSFLVATAFMKQASFLPNYIAVFAAGYLTSILVDTFSEKNKLLYVFLFVLVGIPLTVKGALGALPFAIWAIIIISEVKSVTFLNIIFSSKIASFFGKISYSFYCFHVIFIILSSYLLISVFKISNQNMYAVYLIIGSFLLTTLASYISYKYVELPAMNYAKKKFISKPNL